MEFFFNTNRLFELVAVIFLIVIFFTNQKIYTSLREVGRSRLALLGLLFCAVLIPQFFSKKNRDFPFKNESFPFLRHAMYSATKSYDHTLAYRVRGSSRVLTEVVNITPTQLQRATSTSNAATLWYYLGRLKQSDIGFRSEIFEQKAKAHLKGYQQMYLKKFGVALDRLWVEEVKIDLETLQVTDIRKAYEYVME